MRVSFSIVRHANERGSYVIKTVAARSIEDLIAGPICDIASTSGERGGPAELMVKFRD